MEQTLSKDVQEKLDMINWESLKDKYGISCDSFRSAVLAKAAFSPFGCFSQVSCTCKNSQYKRRNQPRQ